MASTTAFVTCQLDNRILSVGIDPSSSPISIELPAPSSGPEDMAITADQKKGFVCAYSANAVVVVDIQSNTILQTIPIVRPISIAISPDGTMAYVASQEKVYPINTSTYAVGAPIVTGGLITQIKVSPDGTTAYTLSQTYNVLTPIALHSNPPTPDPSPILLPSFGAGYGWIGFVLSPDGKKAYVLASGPSLNASVYPVTLETKTVEDPITDLPPHCGFISMAPQGDTLWVLSSLGDRSASAITQIVVETATKGTTTTLPYAPTNPMSMAITATGQTGYIADRSAKCILPFDLSSQTFGLTIPLPYAPSIIVLSEVPELSAQFSYTLSPAESPSSFDGSASTGAITQYSWDFGDGTTLSTPSPTTTHTYAKAGEYTVTLTITNASHQTDQTTHTVLIVAATAPKQPTLFSGFIKKSHHVRHRYTIYTHWRRSASSNILHYEVFAHAKRLAIIPASDPRRLSIHLYAHGEISKKRMEKRYKVRAVNIFGVPSTFRHLHIFDAKGLNFQEKEAENP